MFDSWEQNQHNNNQSNEERIFIKLEINAITLQIWQIHLDRLIMGIIYKEFVVPTKDECLNSPMIDRMIQDNVITKFWFINI